MKKAILLIFLCANFLSIYAQVTITKTEGNSVVTKLSMGIKVNDGSSLLREKITINDSRCPIQLSNVGVQPYYSFSRSGYTFNPEGNFVTNEPVVAIEIYHVLYDVFGEYMHTLSNTEVVDIVGQHDISKSSSAWYASENDVRSYFSCVSYVANVRTKSGQLWHYDYKAIKEQLDLLKISFEEGYVPKKDKDS